MGILSYGYKALKASKEMPRGKTIKSVKPFSKTGSKTVEQVKQGAAKSKLDAARFNLKETFKKSDKALDKLKDTVKRVPKMGGGMMGRPMYKKGGKSFPDLTGDGKVTKKDILKGRGVPGFSIGGGVGKLKNKLKTTKEKPKIIRTNIKKEFGIKNLDKNKK
tara:strand:- start:478 stop:963 length:486 start_codon:yes stop_codon:yes gene_type:complete